MPPQFRVKDLMITVQDSVAQHPNTIITGCRLLTTLTVCNPCTFVNTVPVTCFQSGIPITTITPTCGGTLPDPTFVDRTITQQPVELAALKAQLQQALAGVEAQERAQAEALRPQTLADVQVLEQKLKEGLEELQARRAELERQG